MSENIQILMATYNAGKWLTPQIAAKNKNYKGYASGKRV